MSEPPPPPASHQSEAPNPTPPPSKPLKESAQPHKYRHPPDAVNPDAVTLRDQWRYAIRQYSRWYSSAWGTAILAGAAFFALGWIVKGENPLPSRAHEDKKEED